MENHLPDAMRTANVEIMIREDRGDESEEMGRGRKGGGGETSRTESVDVHFVRNDHIEQRVADSRAHVALAAVAQAKSQRHAVAGT